MPKHSLPRVAYRLVSGRPLDGKPRTDATYLRRGTRPVSGSRASRWAMLPGWKRQAARLAAPATAVAYTVQPVYTVAAVALLAGLGAVKLRRKLTNRRFVATYITPTVAAISVPLGGAPVDLYVSPDLGDLTPRLATPLSPAEKAVRALYGEHVEPLLRWLPDRAMRAWWATQQHVEPLLAPLRRPVDEVPAQRIQLTIDTPYITKEQRQLISSVISSKIPVADLIESWDMVGKRVTATWTVRKRPPSRVGLADIVALLPSVDEWEFVIGLGTGGRPVVISLKEDSPHIAVSAGSGAGKSVLAQLIAVQVLSRGGRVVILDRKGSHKWAVGLAGVTYCTDAGPMTDELVRLATLADRRNREALYQPDDWNPGQRVLVICEELNATIGYLTDWWHENRSKGDPKTSPAVKGIKELLFMGRSAKVNVIGIAQMLTARAIGGPEARENFGIRALARYSVNNWKMLAPEAAMPRASRTLGRWQIVTGGVATEVQVAYLTAAEARMLATVPGRAGVPDSALSGVVPGDTGVVGDMADPLSEAVTLREAVDRGIVPGKYEAAKKRLQRDRANGRPGTPVPVGRDGLADAYRVGDLIAWTAAERVA